MREMPAGKKPDGFTLQEVMVVIAIGLVITVVALPVMSNAIANMKLRSSMTSVSGLFQDTRALAVKQNSTKTACHFNMTSAPYSLIYFVKDATDCTSATVATADPQVEMEAPITPYGSPTGIGAPVVLDNATQLSVTSSPLTTDPSFNSRGLPCTYSGGAGGWAAISISPAGRIRRWFWNGSSWIG
jgi:prepilin-type N-terminal cleavage/methylation domain-containing protein